MKNIIVLLLFILLNVLSANAQSQDWLWAKKAGGTNDDKGQSITTDASGNVIATGFYRSNSITFESTALTNENINNTADIFLVKYDALGNVIWAKSFGGIGDDVSNSVSTDTSGNIYITGYYYSTSITFGSTTLTNSNSQRNIFVVKYDALGNVVWANNAGKSGTAATVNGNSVSIDGNGNVFVTGYYYAYYFTGNSVSFGNVTLTDSHDGSNVFVVKYNSSGVAQWAKSPTTGTNQGQEGLGISTDASGNVFVTGYFVSATVTFGSTTLNNAGGTSCSVGGCKDIFLVKYDASGNVLWAKSAGGSNNHDLGWSCKTDIDGNIYVTGEARSYTITFGGITLTNLGTFFLVKYDALGNALWAKSTDSGNSNSAIGKSVSIDANSNVYVTGYFITPTVTFGGTTLANAGGSNNTYDVFVLKYDNLGNVIWGNSVGYVNHDEGYGISVDSSGNVFATGFFQSVFITLGSTALSNANSGTSDFFIGKLCQISSLSITASGATTFCQGDSVTLTASSANSYLWSNDSTTQSITVSTSGNYSVFITNSAGCSASSTAAAVIVNPLPFASINASGNTTLCNGDSVILTSSVGSGYLWSTNETTQSITIINSDTYSVSVTDVNGCTATSSNVEITANPTPIIPVISLNGTVLESDMSFGNQWYFEGAIITGETNQNYTPTQNGYYYVLFTDNNGCQAFSDSINLLTVGISDKDNNSQISIFPNPVLDKISIQAVVADNYNLELYNAVGKLVDSSVFYGKLHHLTISEFNSGLYLLFVTNADGRRETFRILKE